MGPPAGLPSQLPAELPVTSLGCQTGRGAGCGTCSAAVLTLHPAPPPPPPPFFPGRQGTFQPAELVQRSVLWAADYVALADMAHSSQDTALSARVYDIAGELRLSCVHRGMVGGSCTHSFGTQPGQGCAFVEAPPAPTLWMQLHGCFHCTSAPAETLAALRGRASCAPAVVQHCGYAAAVQRQRAITRSLPPCLFVPHTVKAWHGGTAVAGEALATIAICTLDAVLQASAGGGELCMRLCFAAAAADCQELRTRHIRHAGARRAAQPPPPVAAGAGVLDAGHQRSRVRVWLHGAGAGAPPLPRCAGSTRACCATRSATGRARAAGGRLQWRRLLPPLPAHTRCPASLLTTAGITYRGLCTSSVVLTESGLMQLTDFRFAKQR